MDLPHWWRIESTYQDIAKICLEWLRYGLKPPCHPSFSRLQSVSSAGTELCTGRIPFLGPRRLPFHLLEQDEPEADHHLLTGDLACQYATASETQECASSALASCTCVS